MNSLAYTARGRLYLLENGQARAIESPFAKTLQEQRAKTYAQRAIHRGSMLKGSLPPQMLTQMEGEGAPQLEVRVSSVCRAPDGFFYALLASDIGAFCAFDTAKNSERRLFHSQEMQLNHLAHNPNAGLVACTVSGGGETAIGVMKDDGRRPDLLTEGDILVLSPSWIPANLSGEKRELLFSSAGIARDANGFLRERKPYTIERLDVDSGELGEVAAMENHDLLGAKMAEDGTIYAIRRPFESLAKARGQSKSFGQTLLDVVLFGPRFLVALVGWANFFSWRYTGKPLTTPQNEEQKRGNERAKPAPSLAWNEVFTPEDARKSRGKTDSEEGTSWVSSDWQLVKRAPGKTEWETVAEKVLAFDLGPRGELICSNGGTIWRLENGVKTKLHSDSAIETVLAL